MSTKKGKIMKRWFLAKLDFYEEPENEGGALVPKTNLHTTSNGGPINTRIWSRPGFGWCFGQLATDTLTSMNADPDIYILPDASLDISWSTVPSGKRTEVKNRVADAGFNFTGIKTSNTIREILQHLKKQVQIDDDIESGDVKDD